MQNVKLIRLVSPKASIVDGKTCIEDDVRDLRVQFTDDDGRAIELVFDGRADCTNGAFNGTRREVYSLHPLAPVMLKGTNKAINLSDPSIRPMSAVVDALLGSPPPVVPVVPKVAVVLRGGVVEEVRVDAGTADITVFNRGKDFGLSMLREAYPVVVY
jgi:hypothetical protein